MIGIYGANGFVGRHLVRHLVDRQERVRAVSRRFDMPFIHSLNRDVEFFEGDLLHSIDMASSLAGLDTVIQLVSTSSPGMENEFMIADIEDNVIPHVKFLHACVQAGVRRYIYLSSGGTVYGPDAPIPTTEASPTQPINSHGLTKLTVEKYIQMYGHVEDMEYVILRVTNLFGPGQEFRKGQGIIPMLIDSWKRNLPVTILGDGEMRRDYVFIDDAIRAMLACVDLEGTPQKVINIGSGETRTVNEVIATIEAVTGHVFERRHLPHRKTDVAVSYLDISLARESLGWTPEIDFHEGVEATVRNG